MTAIPPRNYPLGNKIRTIGSCGLTPKQDKVGYLLRIRLMQVLTNGQSLSDTCDMRWIFALCLLAAPAAADVCDDLWFTRNLIMDRAGFCFGSALGQAQFDNRDCIGKNVSIDQQTQNFVAQIQSFERRLECRVNTGQPVLDLKDAHIRRTLDNLPLADEFQSACLGWKGAPTPLYAGLGTQSRIIGYIMPGDRVGFGHIPAGDWSYVTASGPDWQPHAGGWLFCAVGFEACTDWAG